MNQNVTALNGELIDDFNKFFPPVSTDLVAGLAARYKAQRAKIEQFYTDYTEHELGAVIGYFCRRNGEKQPVFDLQNAICGLNSDFWQEAFALTDVYSLMPQKRRDQWNDQMTAWREPRYKHGENPAMDLPDFDEDVVRATLIDQLNSRARYFAERVDGIFRTLSREHVTNCPQGFNKRMILPGVLESWGFVNASRSGTIHDLRCVVARFMGREEPAGWRSDDIIKAASRRAGDWQIVDGGAFRIRVYNGVGTAHIEVHPDMAWRLNAVLASLYPAAIPESFRRKPVKQKKIKDFVLFDKPLPFAVLRILSGMSQARELNPNKGFREDTFIRIKNALEMPYGDLDKQAVKQAEDVLFAIGAVKETNGNGSARYQFDYDPADVINEIVCSGCIPDHKSHQFYPTPESVANDAVAEASKGATAGMWWLEPSAGIGNLADLFPVDAKVNCYEISKLHCSIMEAKGYYRTGDKTITCADFLKDVAENYRGGGYDRIVMNPPYSEGRWQAHTKAAAKTLKIGGVLVAVLPTSAKTMLYLGIDFDVSWSKNYDNQFAGTGISVVIMKAVRTN